MLFIGANTQFTDTALVVTISHAWHPLDSLRVHSEQA